MARPELLIFDWDGVFALGTNEVIFEAHHFAVDSLGIALGELVERECIQKEWGKDHQAINQELLREHPHLVPRANRLYMRYYVRNYPKRVRPVPGSSELLDDLADQDYLLALNTAAPARFLKRKIFPKFNIDAAVFAGGIISAYDLENKEQAKPEPYTIRWLMRQNDVPPERTLMIGDSDSDVLVAYYNGVEAVVPLSGNLDRAAAEELGVQPTHIIEDVTKLIGVLDLLQEPRQTFY